MVQPKKRNTPVNETVQDLPLSSTVSSIGTASHHLANSLAKILPPLSKSEYLVDSTTFLKLLEI